MADTETSIANLLAANFVDGQAAGEITPQDMRDLIVSLEVTYGGYYVSASAATTIAGVDTWTKIAGTSLAMSNLNGFSMPADNRLRNDGTGTRLTQVVASISFVTAADNKVIGFGIAKNGTIEAESEIQRKALTAADQAAVSLSWSVELATTDYVEVFCVNRTDAVNLTVNYMTVQAQGYIA